MVIGWREGETSLHFAHEEGFETARAVVPLEALAVPVPQLQAVLLLAVLVSAHEKLEFGICITCNFLRDLKIFSIL